MTDRLPDAPTSARLEFVKGHGTENDFVLVADPLARLELSPKVIAKICDRRAGLGGDGLIRAVPTRSMGSWAAKNPGADWFMDYANSDGTTAEMCGNGIRVFVAYLMDRGLITLDQGSCVAIGTRSGVKQVRREGEGYAVEMGPWSLPGGVGALASDGELLVTTPTGAQGAPTQQRSELGRGLRVDVGNPHLVVPVLDAAALAGLDLGVAAGLDHGTAEDVNVEYVLFTGSEPHLRMRVRERGSGETRSCGTGAVAAVLATRARALRDSGGAQDAHEVPDLWSVDVPGGRLQVRILDDREVHRGREVELLGPAALVAEGTLRLKDL